MIMAKRFDVSELELDEVMDKVEEVLDDDKLRTADVVLLQFAILNELRALRASLNRSRKPRSKR
jgi:hypothetical protein